MGGRPLKTLFLTHEPLTETIAGPAIRVWELAHVLAGAHRVTIGVPNRDARMSTKVDVRRYAGGALRVAPLGDNSIRCVSESDARELYIELLRKSQSIDPALLTSAAELQSASRL